MAGISAGEIVMLVRLAWNIYDSCAAAPEDVAVVKEDVLMMASTLELVQEVAKPGSAMEQKLRVPLRECERSLNHSRELLVKYKVVGLWQSLTWWAGGKEDVEKVQKHLGVCTAQLTAHLVTLGLVANQTVIEERLREKTVARTRDAKQPKKPDAKEEPKPERKPEPKPESKPKQAATPSKPMMECWIITPNPTGFLQGWEKKREDLPQANLEKIVGSLKEPPKSNADRSLLKSDDERIIWLLNERNREQTRKDARYVWCSAAANSERQTTARLGFQIEEKVVAVIKRKMTQEAKDQLAKKKAEERAEAEKKRTAEQKKAAEKAGKAEQAGAKKPIGKKDEKKKNVYQKDDKTSKKRADK
ncbi:hypothetical protein B0A49_01953 [Cryomyces minteri]|uniref:Uncharacterized protein n=1 Tax=Cryomyces minteri TaxID=331657 RepID=A0A4U0XFM2_9PEZI|nr:hypothetical protein B0A49_03908 [Cryomyces minteri]TKA80189.1 hypothetical protein B0A49_01903 [Cryomyces minteri]TKA80202.1 hypothetical protein B0A49_01953 [Cryomyces minteri]